KRKIQADETEVRINLQKEIQSPKPKSGRSLQKKKKRIPKVQDQSRNGAYKKKEKNSKSPRSKSKRSLQKKRKEFPKVQGRNRSEPTKKKKKSKVQSKVEVEIEALQKEK